MPLGKRHRTRVKPAVDDFGNAGHTTTALRAADVDLVNIWLMQLDIFRAVVRQFLEFGDAANHVTMAT